MKDLIDRKAVLKIINDELECSDNIYATSMCITIRRAVNDLPSAQPEIIRCKDCKYWREDHTCKEHSLVSPMLANDFCSRAERRTDE